VIELLRRILEALRGARPQTPELTTAERLTAERLDAAHARLKETIPPPED
jgi:hypothetical protein